MRNPYQQKQTHWSIKLAISLLLLTVGGGMLAVILPMMQGTPDIAQAYQEYHKEGTPKGALSSSANGTPQK